LSKPRKLQNISSRVRVILLRHWDPIGIRDIARCSDEYDNYIPKIVQLLEDGADEYKIREHLLQIETVAMGMRGKPERCRHVAEMLCGLRSE